MPVYSKTTWVDGSLPAIDASKLNKIEQGIFDSLRQDGSTTMSGQLVTTAGSAATPAIAPTGDSNTGIYFPAADTIAFGEGGTEAMRITSAGQILINTTNTDSKVVIQSNDAQIMAFGNGNANTAEMVFRTNTLSDPRGSLSVFGSASTINYQGLQPSTMTLYSTADIAINAESTKHIRFHTGTEKMRITSAGNVGIGTISPTNKLQIDGVTANTSCINAIANTTAGQSFGIALSAGSNSSDYALNIRNAAQTTQLFHITGAGNVGIGTTSPSSILHISSATASYSPSLRITNTGTAINQQSVIAFYTDNATTNQFLIGKNPILGGADTFLSNQANSAMIFETNALERMRITSGGNVGIGVNPNVELHVKGTGEIFRLETTAATGDNFIRFYAPSATTQGYVGYTSFANNNMSINQVLNNDLLFHTNNTERFRIESAGTTRPAANNTYDLGSSTYRWATIYAQNALNTSDARLKTDVAPSTLGLDFIAALNPVQYKWIEGGNTLEKVQIGTETVEIAPAIPAQLEQEEILDEEGNVIQAYVPATEKVPAVTEDRPIYETVVTPREGVRTHFGLIAQEVKAALPDGLDFAGWCLADKDDADSTQSLGYTQLIAPMIKAIQELNAKVEALEAQLNK